MAEKKSGKGSGGVVQWIRLKLAPSTVQELKEEARQAAKEGLADEFEKASEHAEKDIKGKVGGALDQVEKKGKSSARETLTAWQRATGGMRGMLRGIGANMGTAFAAFFAFSAIKGVVKDMWELGSAAAETADKFSITFGAAGVEVQAFIDKFGTLFGLNNTLAQEMTATAGAIVQGMGASQAESAKFSQRMVKLAGDMQSFHNVPIQDTFTAIKSALAGSWEPLDRFGAVIRQADVDAKALTMTGKAHVDQLNQWDRAQAALTLAIERQAVVQDNATLTQGSAANTARNLAAEFENVKIGIATGLLPTFASMLDWVGRNKEGLKSLAENGVMVLAFAGKALWSVLLTLGALVTDVILVGFAAANGVFSATALILATVAEAAAKVGRIMGQDASGIEAWAARMRLSAETADAMSRGYLKGTRAVAQDLGQSYQNIWGQKPKDDRPLVWAPPRPTMPTPDSAATQARESREAEAAAKAAEQALDKEVGALKSILEYRKSNTAELARAHQLQQLFQAELEKGPATLDREVELLGRLATLQEVINAADPLTQSQAIDAEVENQYADRQERMQEDLLDRWGFVGDALADVADGFADAWGDALGLILQDASNVGGAVMALGKGMAASLVGAVSNMAKSKVMQNVASAIEEVAAGFAAMANPFMAWSAPLHFQAAQQHGVAAAAWGLLAGGAGAIAGAIGGGGGGGRGGGGGYVSGAADRVGGSTADGAGGDKFELHVWPGGFNPKDPVHVQILGEGIQELTDTDSRFTVIQH